MNGFIGRLVEKYMIGKIKIVKSRAIWSNVDVGEYHIEFNYNGITMFRNILYVESETTIEDVSSSLQREIVCFEELAKNDYSKRHLWYIYSSVSQKYQKELKLLGYGKKQEYEKLDGFVEEYRKILDNEYPKNEFELIYGHCMSNFFGLGFRG